jgi:hypothetical protein
LPFTIPKLPTVKEVERTLKKRAKHGKRGKRGRKPKVVAKAVRENPILLAVNRESRCEALKVYQPSFEAELAIPVYFNPQIDTLVLDINTAGSSLSTTPKKTQWSSGTWQSVLAPYPRRLTAVILKPIEWQMWEAMRFTLYAVLSGLLNNSIRRLGEVSFKCTVPVLERDI